MTKRFNTSSRQQRRRTAAQTALALTIAATFITTSSDVWAKKTEEECRNEGEQCVNSCNDGFDYCMYNPGAGCVPIFEIEKRVCEVLHCESTEGNCGRPYLQCIKTAEDDFIQCRENCDDSLINCVMPCWQAEDDCMACAQNPSCSS